MSQSNPSFNLGDIASESLEDLNGKTFFVETEGFRYPAKLKLLEGADRLFIMLNGAVDQSKTPLPVFARWNWGKILGGHVLSICDPTLYCDEKLLRGWFLGNAEKYAIPGVISIAKTMVEKLGLPESSLIYYGSSAGGFAAIMAAAFSGKEGNAIAINPQTDLLAYYPSAIRELKSVFGSDDAQALSRRMFPERWSTLIAVFKSRETGCHPRIVIAQNTVDNFHYHNHYVPFAKAFEVPEYGGINTDRSIFSIVYTSPEGHGTEPPQVIRRINEEAIPFLCNSSIFHQFEIIEDKCNDAFNIISLREIPKISYFEIFESKNFTDSICSLEEEGFVAHGRKELPPFKIKIPLNWGEDPYNDNNWMFQLHAWRLLDVYFSALKQNPLETIKYLNIIQTYLKDWFEYNIKGNGCTYSWYDMSAGIRALKISYFLITCHKNKVNPGNECEFIYTLIDEHFRHLANPAELNPGNHGLFQLNGLMALTWTLPNWPDNYSHKQYAIQQMRLLITSQLGEYGVHTEDSPDYHFFTLEKIKKLLAAPWWQIDNTESFNDLLEKSEIAKYWLVSPDKHCVPIGDSTEGEKVKDFIRLYEWPHLRNGNTIGAKLDGYGVVRSDDAVPVDLSSFLFFQAGFHRVTHKHADCLSFVWQESGEYLLIDSGKYGYKQDSMRRYFQSTRAHNTVEIDGKSYSKITRDAYGSALNEVKPFGNGWILSASVTHMPFDVEHEREIIFFPGKFVLIIDKLKAKALEEKSYTAWWHFNPNHAVSRLGDSVIQVEGLKRHRILNGVFCSNHGERATVSDLARGVEKPGPLGWVSKSYLKFEPTTSLGFNVVSSDVVLMAVLFEIRDEGAVQQYNLQYTANQFIVQSHCHCEELGLPSYMINYDGFSVNFE